MCFIVHLGGAQLWGSVPATPELENNNIIQLYNEPNESDLFIIDYKPRGSAFESKSVGDGMILVVSHCPSNMNKIL